MNEIEHLCEHEVFRLTDAVKTLIEYVGEDPNREGLKDTPRRVIEALTEWTSGYGKDPSYILKVFEDGGENYDSMVVEGSIPVYSLCEHHLTAFFGHAHIGYLPKEGRIVGLSKLARVVDIFAKRLQVQERLTNQIAQAIFDNLQPLGVGVVLRCRHLCMESRGVKKSGTVAVTSTLLGLFRTDSTVKSEFLQFVSHLDNGPVPL